MADGPAWEDLRPCSPDPRLALGAAYRRVTLGEPRTPAVPPPAPAALRLPIADI
jgi:cholesterol oxidase